MKNIQIALTFAAFFACFSQVAEADSRDFANKDNPEAKSEQKNASQNEIPSWADMFRMAELTASQKLDRYARESVVAEEKSSKEKNVQEISAAERKIVYSVQSRAYTIYDSSRNRRIPVIAYIPQTNMVSNPVIILSNGLGCSYTSCEYLTQAWARNGFCVISVAHPGSDEAAAGTGIRKLNRLREAYQNHSSGRTRTLDITAVINFLELQYIENKDFAEFDLSRIGVAGVDLGALTAMLTAGQTPPDGGRSLADPRVKAILPISPPIQVKYGHSSTYAAINLPTLYITGTRDNGIIGKTEAAERRIPFDYSTSPERFLLTLNGAEHLTFADRNMPRVAPRDNTAYRATIARMSTIFWKAYLENDATALATMRSARSANLTGNTGRLEKSAR